MFFGWDKRSRTAVFCKNWGLHVRRLGVCGYGYIRGYPWIYPWISTENLWIWIWMENFISTASLSTSGNVDEVFAGSPVDLDVALAEVMFVSAKGKCAVFAIVKPHQSFTIASPLLAQAQRHTASVYNNYNNTASTTTTTTPPLYITRYYNVKSNTLAQLQQRTKNALERML